MIILKYILIIDNTIIIGQPIERPKERGRPKNDWPPEKTKPQGRPKNFKQPRDPKKRGRPRIERPPTEHLKRRREPTPKKLSKLKEDQEAGRVSIVRGLMAGQKT